MCHYKKADIELYLISL